MGNFQSATLGQFCIGGNTIEESFSRTATATLMSQFLWESILKI